jgi:hypothetical protein
MKKIFTLQDILDMGAILFDTYNFTNDNIMAWLTSLKENGRTDCDIDNVFNLIVG